MSISVLYDSRNEKYPICYVGILAFVITVCLPLNFGVSKLPPMGVFLLFAAGFASLVMVTRNEQVGFGFLNHLKMLTKEIRIDTKAKQNVNPKVSFSESELPVEDPFGLLQNVVERIIINHDDHLDLATRVRLEKMNQRLHELSSHMCKL
ncbi:MAG: hypothetical protein ACYC6W_07180 [Nitrosotalea sp.]